ncbi:MAG: hypothetical protein IPL84_05115 [Chitinophagaceae bacterium]|nr:hypothetical protein [Chitinophagaceae bacterium]
MKNPSVFSTMNIMHRALLAGQVIFNAIMFYLVYSKEMMPLFTHQEKMMQIAAIGYAAIAIFAGTSLFKKKLALINDDTGGDARTKLTKYRSASMLQWGLMEAASLVCGICLLLTGNYAFLALSAVLILYFAMLMPVKNRIAAQLNLQSNELDEL